MKRIFTILTVFLLTFSVQAQYNRDLLDILPHINADSIARTIQDLENFDNRYCDHGAGNIDVAEYLVSRLQNYGVHNAAIDSFFLNTDFIWLPHIERYCYNVVGFIPGRENRDSIVIVGAHLDAISLVNRTLQEYAPGADDNASGVAVMLEIARVIHKLHIRPRNTICFMGYDAEEVGFEGSKYDAAKRVAQGDKVIAMLNNDMVSNQPDSLPYTLTLHWYDNAVELAERAAFMCETFTNITPVIPAAGEPNKLRQNSDSWMYAQQDIPAVFAIEYYFSDYYHTVNDEFFRCNTDFAKEVAKMNMALLFELAIGDIYEHNGQTGIENNTNDLSVRFSPNPASDYINVQCTTNTGFEIHVYDLTGRLIMSQSTPDNNIILNINNLESGIYLAEIFSNGKKSTEKFIKK